MSLAALSALVVFASAKRCQVGGRDLRCQARQDTTESCDITEATGVIMSADMTDRLYRSQFGPNMKFLYKSPRKSKILFRSGSHHPP